MRDRIESARAVDRRVHGVPFLLEDFLQADARVLRVFDDDYLVLASASDQDGKRKTPGGLTLYSRATYKALGSVKFTGVGTGKGIALSGGALWVGVPGAEWRPPGLPTVPLRRASFACP